RSPPPPPLHRLHRLSGTALSPPCPPDVPLGQSRTDSTDAGAVDHKAFPEALTRSDHGAADPGRLGFAEVRSLLVLLAVGEHRVAGFEQFLVTDARRAAADLDRAVGGQRDGMRELCAHAVHLVLVADIAPQVVARRTEVEQMHGVLVRLRHGVLAWLRWCRLLPLTGREA